MDTNHAQISPWDATKDDLMRPTICSPTSNNRLPRSFKTGTVSPMHQLQEVAGSTRRTRGRVRGRSSVSPHTLKSGEVVWVVYVPPRGAAGHFYRRFRSEVEAQAFAAEEDRRAGVKTLQASQRLTWLKLPRDWWGDPRLVSAADRTGLAAPAGYVILLGRACQSDGLFANLSEVTAAIRADGLGLPREDAEEVADTLIAVGLITATDLGYQVTDWASLFRPPHSAITKMARGDGRGDERGDTAKQEHSKSESKAQQSSPRLPFSVKTMEINGVETIVLPPRVETTTTHCSHGEAFATIPAGVSRNGRPFEAFVSARHRLPDGTNCHERPEVQQ